ncbi:MAG: 2-phosphosulfolactate phosphatase [Steroidobacteraceae bacterium]
MTAHIFRPRIEVADFVEGARRARGVAVIIDVFRAFSVACYAYAREAERIIPLSGIAESLALKRAHPQYIAIGERDGRMLDGFDFGNSPTEICRADVRGRTILHTTSAGTQGLTNAAGADIVLTGSLVNAAAICHYIAELAPRQVSIVRMGLAARERCAEDDLCAELLCARLGGRPFETGRVRDALRSAPAARKFFDPAATWAPEEDFDLCTDVDRFGFVLRLARGGGELPYLEKVDL